MLDRHLNEYHGLLSDDISYDFSTGETTVAAIVSSFVAKPWKRVLALAPCPN
jgi:hypothetical protein